MFFTGLMLVVALFFCFRPELFRNVHESFPIREAHATSHVATSETASLIGAEIPEKTEEHSKLDELKQKQRVASWISKRYRIAGKASNLFVTTAYKTAFELGLDPHLILAVMAVESRSRSGEIRVKTFGSPEKSDWPRATCQAEKRRNPDPRQCCAAVESGTFQIERGSTSICQRTPVFLLLS